MDRIPAQPRPRRPLRAIVATLAGAILIASSVAAQESPPPEVASPAPSDAPAASAPSSPAASAGPVASSFPTTEPGQATAPAQPRRWTLADMPQRPAGWILNDVIAGGPGFIAVGAGSRGRARSVPEALIWASDDGRRFQSVPLFGDAAEGTIRAIATAPNGFVAVGEASSGAAVWTSADGIGWQRLPHTPAFDESVMLDVANGPAGLVAIGCQGTIECATSRAWRSTDGVTWESLDNPPPGLPLAIEATEDGYLVAGQQPPGAVPMIASSADGTTWEAAQGLPPGPAGLAALGMLGDALAGGSTTESGADRALLLRSADGSAWQQVGHRSFRAADFGDMASNADGVVLVGTRTQRVGQNLRTRPLAIWSADLQRFRTILFPAQSLRAGGEINAAAFSPDGDLIVAVGATARPVPTVWFSRMAVPEAPRRQGQGERSGRDRGGRSRPRASEAPDTPVAETTSPTQAPAD